MLSITFLQILNFTSKLAHIQTFPPSVTLLMFTHRAPVSILLLSSACIGLTGSHFSTSILNTLSVGTRCPYTAQVQTQMHGHRASTTAAGATTLSSRTYEEGWPNITLSPHLLPSLELMLLLVQQTRLVWLHREPQQRIN